MPLSKLKGSLFSLSPGRSFQPKNPQHTTTMMRLTLALLLTATCAIGTQGFVPVAKSFVRSVAVNNMALLIADNEEDATYLLHKAEECALSDSCSVDDAKLFLREVIHLESGCAAGTLVGHDICEDQDHLAMIVANLRAKVERGEASHTTLDETQRVGVTIAVGSLALVAAISMATQQQHDAVPFTAQEWWWAIQGGYLDTMVAHFVRNGGI